jgi:hypothetical protein
MTSENVPVFLEEHALPANILGGRARVRVYAWRGATARPPSRDACNVLYTDTEMVLTDFRTGQAIPRARDPTRAAAADCDRFIEDALGQ